MKVDSAREVAATEPTAPTASAPRLVVGYANDPYEAAADRAADEVISRLSAVPSRRAAAEVADTPARSLQAETFTSANDIYFASRQYDPNARAVTQGIAHTTHDIGTMQPVRRELADGAAAATPAATEQIPAAENAEPVAAGAAGGTPAAAEPAVVVEPGSALSVEAQAARVPQWTTLKERLTERGYANPTMIDMCAKYVLAITAPAPAMDIVKNLLKDITDQLHASQAFDRHAGDDQDADYADGFNLWSGAKEQAKQFGEDNGGVALESSAAGSLFDGLTFDMKWNEALSHQWNELSRLYAEGIRGKVHIHQYRGVRTGSVFNKIEYPTIKDSIAAGLIEPVIHLYANHGALTNVVWNTPIYGAGETSRKQEKVLTGKSALDGMMAAQWEYGDAVEKSGGYWPSGKGGEPGDHPLSPGTKVRPGEAW